MTVSSPVNSSLQAQSFFQPGGPLQRGRLYVQRPADEELFATVKRGAFCYVLAPRQIGKSSLSVHTVARLEAVGIRCAWIELTKSAISEEEWYYSLVSNLWEELELSDDVDEFWQSRRGHPLDHFQSFLSDVVLRQIDQPVAIFLDEIETTLNLPFRRDDFFATIRHLYNKRAQNSDLERLTFCLVGVTTPSNLIEDSGRTPFNIGQAIRLEDFERDQMDALLPGLQALNGKPQALLDAIYKWTSGHPYMTQRICDALVEKGPNDAPEQERVHQLVSVLFLQRGRTEDSNLSTTDRFFAQDAPPKLNSNEATGGREAVPTTSWPQTPPWYLRHRTAMLQLYRRLLEGERVPADGSDPVQMALRLTGIAAERRDETERVLKVRNDIFAKVFDNTWLKGQEAGRLIADTLAGWVASGRQDDYLLRGQQLKEAHEWAAQQAELTLAERQFLDSSRDLAQREEQQRLHAEMEIQRAQVQRAEERARSATRLRILSVALALLLVVAARAALIATQQSQQAVKSEQQAKVNARLAQKQEAKALEQGKRADEQARLAARRAGQAEQEKAKAVKAQQLAVKERDRANRAKYEAEQAATREKMARRQAEDAKRQADEAKQQALKSAAAERTAKQLAILEKARAVREARNAQGQAKNAQHIALIANSLLHSDTDLSVLLAVEAVKFRPTKQAKDALQQSLSHGRVMWSSPGSIIQAYFGSDGKSVFVIEQNNNKIIKEEIDAVTGEQKSKDERPGAGSVSPPPNDATVEPSNDGTVKIREKSGRIVTLSGYRAEGEDRVVRAAFSPNREFIVTVTARGTAKLWEASTGRYKATLPDKVINFPLPQFSPDSKLIATLINDHPTKIWAVDTGDLKATLLRHADILENTAFSPDSKSIIVAGYNVTDTGTNPTIGTNAAGGAGGASAVVSKTKSTVRIYQIVVTDSTADLLTAARRHLGNRQLTPQERVEFLHETPSKTKRNL